MSSRIAVLASGGGSNLQALIDFLGREPSSIGEIVLVASDRDSCGALDRARSHGIESVWCAPGNLGELLERHRVDLVALAGYLKFIPAEVTRHYSGRMLNVHPSLLPSFGGKGMYGRRVHEEVIRSGLRITGVTVHFVNDEYDRGPVVAQWPVPVLPGDTPDTLAMRVLGVEHILYPRAVSAIARGAVVLDAEGRVSGVSFPEPPPFAFGVSSSHDDIVAAIDGVFDPRHSLSK
jgi:phosphoribosylglycinamide formyltransferase 1